MQLCKLLSEPVKDACGGPPDVGERGDVESRVAVRAVAHPLPPPLQRDPRLRHPPPGLLGFHEEGGRPQFYDRLM